MLHSTKKTQEDILNTQKYVEENQNKQHSSTELIHKEPIENSPLWIIGNEETGYFVSIKNYRLTELYKTIEEAKDRLRIESWNIIVRLTAIIMEIITEEHRKEKVSQQWEENQNQSNG